VTRTLSKETPLAISSEPDIADLHSSTLGLLQNATLDGDDASTVHHTTNSGDSSGFRFEGRACEQREKVEAVVVAACYDLRHSMSNGRHSQWKDRRIWTVCTMRHAQGPTVVALGKQRGFMSVQTR
jgi:hypothetical protein